MPFDPVRSRASTFHVPQRLDPRGESGPTRNQAKRSRWVRVGPGLYVPTGTDRALPEQRVVEVVARYPGATVSGWGALWFHGAAYFDGRAADGRTPLPAVVLLPTSTGRRASTGVRLSYEPVHDADRREIDGVRVTSAVRALFDEVRATADLREAVVAVDMAAAARLVAPEDLIAYADTRRRWRRSSRVAPAVRLSTEMSRSPNESRVRLVWLIDCGLPAPLVNQEVFDRAGRLVCTADLLDPVAGLVVEFDGAEHRRARRHTQDVARQDRCRRLGLEYSVVTGTDLLDRAAVAERLLAARSRARFDDPAHRAWTVEVPDGWQVSPTWADERALAAWTHEQLARELSDARRPTGTAAGAARRTARP